MKLTADNHVIAVAATGQARADIRYTLPDGTRHIKHLDRNTRLYLLTGNLQALQVEASNLYDIDPDSLDQYKMLGEILVYDRGTLHISENTPGHPTWTWTYQP